MWGVFLPKNNLEMVFFGHSQNPSSNSRVCLLKIGNKTLGISKVLDARRRGAPTEAYN